MENANKESLSFYVHEDFAIKLGKEEIPFLIPRMSFITGGKFITKVAEIKAKDLKGAIGVLLKANDKASTSIDDIQSIVSQFIEEKNFGLISELIELITEGIINKEIITTTNSQYGEVVQLLVVLIERNFSSLKNLFASLQVIISNGQ